MRHLAPALALLLATGCPDAGPGGDSSSFGTDECANVGEMRMCAEDGVVCRDSDRAERTCEYDPDSASGYWGECLCVAPNASGDGGPPADVPPEPCPWDDVPTQDDVLAEKVVQCGAELDEWMAFEESGSVTDVTHPCWDDPDDLQSMCFRQIVHSCLRDADPFDFEGLASQCETSECRSAYDAYASFFMRDVDECLGIDGVGSSEWNWPTCAWPSLQPHIEDRAESVATFCS